jgi:hypothetical protein
MSTGGPIDDDILFVKKKTLVLAYQSLLWMIRSMEWANKQTGLDSGLSPELFKATQARDALRKVLDG